MSIRNESFPASGARADEPDRIIILTADHTSRTVLINKDGLTVGSRPDNDIVLDDPQVAEYHARVEHAENGTYRVIDLNSPSGTFVGQVRLHPGDPADWNADQALRIGDNWLGLRPAKEEAREADTQPRPPLPEFDPNQILWSPRKQIGLYVGTSQITIAPGKSAEVSLVLFNRGGVGDRVNLTVSGVPANWVGSLSSMVVVPENGEQSVNLLFQLPADPTARAGRHAVAIKVSSQNVPGEQLETSIVLTVLAFSRFVSGLHPDVVTPNESAQVKIENLGNIPETYIITGEDPSGEIKFEMRDEWIRLAEGETALIELRVVPPLRFWNRSGQTHPFSVQVRSNAGQVHTHSAEVMGRALLPSWALPVLLVASVCLCSGLTLLMADSAGLFATPTPTATLSGTQMVVDADGDGLSDVDEMRFGTNPALPDTDGDGLRDGDEQRAGTNPLAIDSDGDTLTDGREVAELRTSPINPDTDGDGLNDNVDPDPGQLPTPTPLPPTPTWTPLPPTPTFTALPATATSPPPTAVPPSATSVPPTAVPPSATTVPPTQPPPVTISGWIAFESRRDGNLEIYLYRADTRSELRLTNNTVDDRRAVWAPPGTRIAFDSDRDGNSEVYAMNTDGTAQTRLTNNPARDFNPVWSPDGSRVAFLSDRDGNVEIYAMNADGSSQIRLTDTTSSECCPLFSPLGSLIAFMSDRAGGWGLYRMNGDGADQRFVASAIAAAPSWSPDGGRLAFVSDRDGNAEIYTVNSDGSNERRLTNNSGQDMTPIWSPNGSKIAFLSNQDGNPELYIMNPDGSGQTRLTNTPSNECCLVWSPDGSQLAFVSDRDGNFEIYVVNINTLGLLRLTNNPAYDAPLAWRP